MYIQKVKIMITIMLIITALLCGCKKESGVAYVGQDVPAKQEMTVEQEESDEIEDIDAGITEESSDNSLEDDDSFYEIVELPVDKAERQAITDELQQVFAHCSFFLQTVEKEDTTDLTLKPDEVHQMADLLADKGYTVTCVDNKYNMRNVEETIQQLEAATRGEEAEITLYKIDNTAGIHREYMHFTGGKMILTSTILSCDAKLQTSISYMEKMQVYSWKYTDKGWLIYEMAPTRNQEMDMHVITRVKPLPDICREMCDKYITPIGYGDSNVFRISWDAENKKEITWNQLFPLLYAMREGEHVEEAIIDTGVTKELFESVLQTYFEITPEELENFAAYNEEEQIYAGVDTGTGVPVVPYPEVVKVEEEAGGIRKLYVEAYFKEGGTDCLFAHTVTIKEENGAFKYVSNTIDNTKTQEVPVYFYDTQQEVW